MKLSFLRFIIDKYLEKNFKYSKGMKQEIDKMHKYGQFKY